MTLGSFISFLIMFLLGKEAIDSIPLIIKVLLFGGFIVGMILTGRYIKF
ncbi:hypothetical protein PP2015_3743 [Pseudoalteromonas phenolica]|uniref:Uncharacterized protein n=2 Tax=Pseudoalteromonas TaxID=53246 RepID=A0A0S2K715_9GAMM|nr:hypothetical protein PP2015_3743 [Pseudoalteromonas phenolica]